MDAELRQLQRIAYNLPAEGDWPRYCRALERIHGIGSPKPIKNSALDAMIENAGHEQKLAKEWSKILLDRMVAREAEFFDFPVSTTLQNALDAIPKEEDSTNDEVPPVFRFVLKTSAYSGDSLVIERVGGGYGHAYTLDSSEVGGAQRFYTILRALFEEIDGKLP